MSRMPVELLVSVKRTRGPGKHGDYFPSTFEEIEKARDNFYSELDKIRVLNGQSTLGFAHWLNKYSFNDQQGYERWIQRNPPNE